MTISAINALNNWKNAIDKGDLAGLDNMLADDFIFENRLGDKDDKNTVPEWANNADFTCNEFIVYHEDDVCFVGDIHLKHLMSLSSRLCFLPAMKMASANFGKFTAVEALFNQLLVQLTPKSNYGWFENRYASAQH